MARLGMALVADIRRVLDTPLDDVKHNGSPDPSLWDENLKKAEATFNNAKFDSEEHVAREILRGNCPEAKDVVANFKKAEDNTGMDKDAYSKYIFDRADLRAGKALMDVMTESHYLALKSQIFAKHNQRIKQFTNQANLKAFKTRVAHSGIELMEAALEYITLRRETAIEELTRIGRIVLEQDLSQVMTAQEWSNFITKYITKLESYSILDSLDQKSAVQRLLFRVMTESTLKESHRVQIFNDNQLNTSLTLVMQEVLTRRTAYGYAEESSTATGKGAVEGGRYPKCTDCGKQHRPPCWKVTPCAVCRKTGHGPGFHRRQNDPSTSSGRQRGSVVKGSGGGVCYQFQKGQCSNRQCKYKHLCEKCGSSNHGRKECAAVDSANAGMSFSDKDLKKLSSTQMEALNALKKELANGKGARATATQASGASKSAVLVDGGANRKFISEESWMRKVTGTVSVNIKEASQWVSHECQVGDAVIPALNGDITIHGAVLAPNFTDSLLGEILLENDGFTLEKVPPQPTKQNPLRNLCLITPEGVRHPLDISDNLKRLPLKGDARVADSWPHGMSAASQDTKSKRISDIFEQLVLGTLWNEEPPSVDCDVIESTGNEETIKSIFEALRPAGIKPNDTDEHDVCAGSNNFVKGDSGLAPQVCTGAIGTAHAAKLLSNVVNEFKTANASSTTIPTELVALHAATTLEDWHGLLGHLNYRDTIRVLRKHNIKIPKEGVLRRFCECCVLAKHTKHPTPQISQNDSGFGEGGDDRVGKTIYGDSYSLPALYTGRRKHYRSQFTTAYVFVDRYSGMTSVHLVRDATAEAMLREFDAFTTHLGVHSNVKEFRVDRFHADSGPEFTADITKQTLEGRGIRLTFAAALAKEQNGRVERAIRVITEMAKALLLQAKLGKEFLPYAMMHAAFLRNHCPQRMKNYMSAQEIAKGTPLDMNTLHLFGAECYTLENPVTLRKGDNRNKSKIWLGFDRYTARSVVFNPITNEITSSLHVQVDDSSCMEDYLDVEFGDFEDEAMFGRSSATVYDDVEHWKSVRPKQTKSVHNDTDNATVVTEVEPAETLIVEQDDAITIGEIGIEPATVPSPTPPQIATPIIAPIADLFTTAPIVNEANRKCGDSGGMTKENAPCQKRATRLSPRCREHRQQTDDIITAAMQSNVTGLNDPTTWADAMKSKYKDDCIEALGSEVEHLRELRNFKEVKMKNVEAGVKVLPTVVVPQVKRHLDGSFKKIKVRGCIRGYAMQEGAHYDKSKVFSPVASGRSLRLLLSWVAEHKGNIEGFDVSNAFQTSDADKVLYVHPLPGQPTTDKDGDEILWELLKTWQGQVDASHLFWKTVDTLLTKELGFTRSIGDPCIFVNNDGSIIILVYVDDFLIGIKNGTDISAVKEKITSNFTGEWSTEVFEFIGCRIRNDTTNGIVTIDQESYALAILERFGFSDATTLSTPMEPKLTLEKHEGASVGKVYNEIVGCLLFLVCMTRCDLSFAVGYLCRFMSNPGPEHLAAAKHVLRYLVGTSTYCMSYGDNIEHSGEVDGVLQQCESKSEVECFVDADFTNTDVETSRCVTGYVIKRYGGLIEWSAKLQPDNAQATGHAEYMAIFFANNAVQHNRQCMKDIHLPQTQPTKIYEDNNQAITWATSVAVTPANRFFKARYHATRASINEKSIELIKVGTQVQVADAWSKALPRPGLQKHIVVSGMRDATGDLKSRNMGTT